MTDVTVSNARRIVGVLLILLLAVLGATVYIVLSSDSKPLGRKKIR